MKLIVLGLAGATLCSLAACADYPPPPRERIIVEEHLVRAPPPPPRAEVIIAAPGPHERFVWDPGHWSWDGRGYRWIGGHWIERRSGEWIPARWVETPGGWRFVEGHWR